LTRKPSCLLRGVHSDMTTIMTVCGPIPADKRGLKSMHDHIQANLSFFKQPITDIVEKDSLQGHMLSQW
jgi:predicted metal-dependent phosphotriesterase family hydrolase